ncbi:MAG: NADH-quinone oxidoreductase subunit H [Planctomycetota bacterium]|nr:NADH-quinone oxidoreductase subunit H [Planctomycetota bacterium]
MLPLYDWLMHAPWGVWIIDLIQTVLGWVWLHPSDHTLALLIGASIPVVVVFFLIQAVAGGSTYIERKVAADIQRRVGPNQCNPSNFLGAVFAEAVARGQAAGASKGHQFFAKLAAPLVPVFKLLDAILGRIAPGLLIFLADGIKLIMKEDLVPSAADKPMFKLAPAIVLASAFAALAALPYSDGFYVADFNIGVFYIAAITSIEAIGILMAGWASNNKWALLGGMRSAAQIVSYEIPVGLALLTGIILSGTMSMQGMIHQQYGFEGVGWSQGWWWNWNVFASPFMLLLFPVYYLAGLAECNRTPFDIPEAESELVAGYHTEYSGMRFAFFFMAEYAMMCVVSAIAVTIFLGGWSTGIGPLENWMMVAKPGQLIPGTETVAAAPVFGWLGGLVHLVAFLVKTYLLVFVMMWIRWTLPRFRVDQMMTLCWKKLIPLSLACMTGASLWMLVRPWIVSQENPEALGNLTALISMVLSLAIGGFLFWWFFLKKLSPDEQRERKLLVEANISAQGGKGFA